VCSVIQTPARSTVVSDLMDLKRRQKSFRQRLFSIDVNWSVLNERILDTSLVLHFGMYD
jgi:hypothetical protein